MNHLEFEIVRHIARHALHHSQGQADVRRYVNQLRLVFEREEQHTEAQSLGYLLQQYSKRDQENGPTQETRQKLRQSSVEIIAQACDLDGDRGSAIKELTKIMRGIGRGFTPGSRDLNAVPLPTGHVFSGSVETMNKDMAEIYSLYYKPWANKMTRARLVNSNIVQCSVLAMVWAVLMDNRYPSEIAWPLTLRTKQVVDRFAWALDQYNEIRK